MQFLILFAGGIAAVNGLSFPAPEARLMTMESEIQERIDARADFYERLRAFAVDKHAENTKRLGHAKEAHVEVPPPNLRVLATEDVTKEVGKGAPRYANRTHVTEGPAFSGSWKQLSPDTLQWTLLINSAGATSMNLGFEHFHLPEDASLTISSHDEQFMFHLTHKDNKPHHNQFWTPPIPGGHVKLVAVLHAEKRQEVEDGLILSRVNVGYRGFHAEENRAQEEAKATSAKKCHFDAHCKNVITDFDHEIPCTAVISTGGELFCSGSMLNNNGDVKDQGRPFFLTAHHCEITEDKAPSLVTCWNYEDTKDTWNNKEGSEELDCPGNKRDSSFIFHWQSGAKWLRADYKPSDYTLVELDNRPPEEWQISYCGFNAKDQGTQWSVAIHHPSTYHKRKSKDTDPGRVDGNFIHIDHYEIGSTEPGSSGCPLFNEHHQVVAQLNGGLADCNGKKPNPEYDQYGRLAVSWWHGMKEWLDPHNKSMEAKTLSGLGPADVNKDGKISVKSSSKAYGCGSKARAQCNGKEACFEAKNIGDGYCDGMNSDYGINACCYSVKSKDGKDLLYDGGDCTAAQCTGSTGPIEALKFDEADDDFDVDDVDSEIFEHPRTPTKPHHVQHVSGSESEAH